MAHDQVVDVAPARRGKSRRRHNVEVIEYTTIGLPKSIMKKLKAESDRRNESVSIVAGDVLKRHYNRASSVSEGAGE